jgi:hypothetical protein
MEQTDQGHWRIVNRVEPRKGEDKQTSTPFVVVEGDDQR